MGELETVAQIFMLMGLVLILGYMIPVILGHIDDKRMAKARTKENQRWKCKCGAILVNHCNCAACNVLNRSGVQAWCPDCLYHPKDPIAC